MHRSNYAIAALAVITFVSPSLAKDMSKAAPSAKTERSLPPGGEVKRETAGRQMGGDKIRSGDDRAGLQIETRKGEPGWDRARAEQVVVAYHRHHRHEM